MVVARKPMPIRDLTRSRHDGFAPVQTIQRPVHKNSVTNALIIEGHRSNEIAVMFIVKRNRRKTDRCPWSSRGNSNSLHKPMFPSLALVFGCSPADVIGASALKSPDLNGR